MSPLLTAAFACHLIVILAMFGFGFNYLLRKQCMPYHEAALGKPWGELPNELQTVLLAVMRAVSGGILAMAVLALVVLLIPFRAGMVWAVWALPVAALVLSTSSLYAFGLVAANTPGNPPYKPVLATLGLSLLGLVLSLA